MRDRGNAEERTIRCGQGRTTTSTNQQKQNEMQTNRTALTAEAIKLNSRPPAVRAYFAQTVAVRRIPPHCGQTPEPKRFIERNWALLPLRPHFATDGTDG